MNRHVNIKQREYDRLYKEMDDLYHAVAKKEGLSDSALIIFMKYTSWGMVVFKKKFVSGHLSASRPFIPRSTTWKGTVICVWKRATEETGASI